MRQAAHQHTRAHARALLITCAAALPLATACTQLDPDHLEQLRADVITRYPFDADSFTQGLEFDNTGNLLVSTGWWGEGRVYRTTIEGTETATSEVLDPVVFGEGITVAQPSGPLWQLTWKAGTAYKRDPHTLRTQDIVTYQGQGWGLCAYEDYLVMSDGSATLTLRDPHTFDVIGTRDVINPDTGEKIDKLNELDCTYDRHGHNAPRVLANRFLTTDVYEINPDDGHVTAHIDASGLPNNATPDPNNVLNGIATANPHERNSDAGTAGRLFMTGKRWPDLYEVALVNVE